MKKFFIYLFCSVLSIYSLKAQTYTINQGGTVSTCSGTFYDSGGAGAQYGNDEDNIITFCSSTPGEQIKVSFSSFISQSGIDILYIYDGNTTANLLNTYSGTVSSVFSATSTTGCLTFRFTSNGSTVKAGWVAAISCVASVVVPNTCDGAAPFCTNDTVSFPASVDAESEFPSGVGCLSNAPNPAFYFLKINNPGDIVVHIESKDNYGETHDVDFICWGPFPNPTGNCIEGLDTTEYSSMGTPHTTPPLGTNIVDCSYSIDAVEDCYIYNALSGQFYLLLITNFSNDTSNINFGLLPGSIGTTDCNIVNPNCIISDITAVPSACDASNNQYSVSGSITFVDAPYSGTLTVSDQNGHSQVLIAPFTSPTVYNLTGIESDGATDTIFAFFSGDLDCIDTAVYVAPNPCAEANAGSPVSICEGSSTTLNATGGTSYVWSPATGLSATNISNPIATPSVTTTYIVTVSVATATDSASVVVTVNPIPNVTINTSANELCQGTTALLVASSPVINTSYSWSDLSVNDSLVVSPNETTVYTVTTTSNNCMDSQSITISVSPVPSADLGSDRTICPGESTVLYAGNTIFAYNWSTGQNTPAITVSDSISYSVTVTSLYCGSETDDINVAFFPIPTVYIGADTVGCIKNIRLSVPDIYKNYFWSTGETTSAITINYPADYSITISDFNGCNGEDHRIYGDSCYVDLYIPNTFTPNHDGINEKFVVNAQNISAYEISIYNRWGELVYNATDIRDSWDGKYNDKEALEGVYVYWIQYTTALNVKQQTQGTFLLLK